MFDLNLAYTNHVVSVKHSSRFYSRTIVGDTFMG